MQTHTPISRFRPTLLAIISTCAGLFLAAPAWAGGETPGDDCFNALPAVVGANGPVNTATMTPSADPPGNDSCASLNWGNSRDAWWVFDAPIAGSVTVAFCDSDFDTSVVVYQGSCGALARIACDDDSCAPAGPLYQSKISALKVAAGPVYVRVGGYTAQTGNVRFTLAFAAAGSTECWGKNDYGQCTVPAGIGAVTAVAAGDDHTVAIKANGSVVCWGSNELGQCAVPAGLGAVTAVAAGNYHTVAIKANGSVVCWGWNFDGQCSVPAGLGTVARVAAGEVHTVAIKANGSVVCWGGNSLGQLSTPSSIRTAGVIGAGLYHTIAVEIHDCDRNGTADRLEIAAHDCDANGIHDCWDAETGSIEDCNSNGLGDRCEKTLQVLANSGHLGPIGAAHNQTFVMANAAPALEPDRVTVRVKARGDFSGGLEYLRVRIGTTFDVQALGGTVDCGAGTPTQSFTMDAADFNAAIDADGALRVRLEPSIAVDWNLCPEGTWAEVELSYLGAQPADCNLNGVLDSCELADGLSPDTNNNGVPDTCETPFTACPGDFDGNNTVSGSDLGALLGSWGPCPPGAVGDMDSNGVINGADLGALLGAWGPCDN